MRICCLCTGNTCRSPMLAALLRRSLDEAGLIGHSVTSAGTSASLGTPANANAVLCMSRRGIDICAHRSRPLDPGEIRCCDLFLCLGVEHAEILVRAGVQHKRIMVVNESDGGVPDPFGGDEEIYESCAQCLEAAIPSLIKGMAG